MRILIATPLYPPAVGGPAKYAASLVGAFRSQDYGVQVVAYGSLEGWLPIGVRHVVYALRLLPAAWRADAILALDTWSVGLPALLVARLCGAKLLVRIGGDFLWESYVERTGKLVRLSDFYKQAKSLTFKERIVKRGTSFLLRHADALLFNTGWQRDIWTGAYDMPSRSVYIVENEYPPVHARAAEGKVFVAAGRDIILKNMGTLRAAFAAVRERHPEISLDTRVLPPAEHAQRLERCYAVIVPSVSEVNPNTAIEALAAGKPFISTMDSGIGARVGAAGMFIDTLDVAALERAIEGLLDPQRYEEARVRVCAFAYTHSWDDMAKEIADIVRAI